MFHVKHIKFHQLFFYLFLFLLPFQTRILYNPESAYINGVFNYYLAFFLYLSDLVLILCFTTWLIFDPPNPKILLDRKNGLILAFFGLILATLFYPPALSELWWTGVKHIDLGLYQALKWLELWLLFVYISYNWIRETMFHRALWVLFIVGIIQAGIGIGQFHVKHMLGLEFLGEYVSQIGTAGLATIDFASEKLIRAYGTMPHPNVLGGFLILALISGFFLVSSAFPRTPIRGSADRRETSVPETRETSKIRLFLVSCGTIVILLGIFFSFSRIAWISAIFAILAFLMFHVKHRNWLSVIVIVIVIVILFGTIIIGYRGLLNARTSESSVSQALNYRTQFNSYGLELVKQYPILGVGVGQYIPALQDLHKFQPWQYQPPHNIFIFLAAELGILGVGLFVVILFEIFKTAWPQKNQLLPFSLLIAELVLILIGNFDHYLLTIQQGRLMFFTILGLIAAMKNLESGDNGPKIC